ncbi:hypothetical protein BJV82DRAFT_573966 [Fennellomyces sp. T-0311]|nr:hypothetical protein BJV82DRAFT_573966 [Fennellomyces sp. T-0311]
MATSSSSEEPWPLVFDSTMAYMYDEQGLRTPESPDFSLLPYIPENYYAQQQVCYMSPAATPEEKSCPTPQWDPNSLTRDQLIERVLQLERERLHYYWPPLHHHHHHHHPQQQPPAPPAPEEEITYYCRWNHCDVQTCHLDELIAHIRDIHVGSGKAAYYCEWAGCPRQNKPFMKRHKMHNHMRTHTGEKPFVCTIEDCDKRFSRLDSLNTHIKTHSSVRPFKCSIPDCTKAYFHSRSLRKHIKAHQQRISASASNKKKGSRRRPVAAASTSSTMPYDD